MRLVGNLPITQIVWTVDGAYALYIQDQSSINRV